MLHSKRNQKAILDLDAHRRRNGRKERIEEELAGLTITLQFSS